MSYSRGTLGLLALLLFGLGLAARLLPHPPNFVPIAAIALFAGFLFGGRPWVVAIPLSAMVVGDVMIGTYDWRVMAVVYAALAVPVLLSHFLAQRPGWGRVAGLTVASSLLFFGVTNLAVWYFGSLYTHDWAGLVECYVAATPFLRFTLAGDLCWAAVLFGGYALAQVGLPRLTRRRLAPARVPRVAK